MPQVITAQSFSLQEREARKDFIDKHTTPFYLLHYLWSIYARNF